MRRSAVTELPVPSGPPPRTSPRPSAAGRVTVRKVAGSGHSRPAVPFWLQRFGLISWYLIGIIIIVAMLVFATLRIQLVFIAVFIALVFTSVLNPLVNHLDRVMPRALAVVVAILASFAFFGGMLFYVVSSVVNQWNNLARQFQNGIGEILDLLENGNLPFHVTQDEIFDWLNQVTNEVTQYIQSNAGDLAGQVVSNAGSAAIVFTILALSLFVTIFMLARGGSMWLWFLNWLPSRWRVETHRAAGAAWYTFSGYARGTVIIALADGLMAYTLLAITKVPLAAPLSVLVFIGAFIPLIGAPLAMVIATIVALAAKGWVVALVIMLGIALIGQIEGHILQPLVMGKQVSLHPVVVALGVTAGTFLGGLLGAIVAIPLLAVIWSVFATLHTPDPPMSELPQLPPPSA